MEFEIIQKNKKKTTDAFPQRSLAETLKCTVKHEISEKIQNNSQLTQNMKGQAQNC